MKALIVVDMLNDFCHPDGVLAKSIITGELYAKPIIAAIKELVDQHYELNDGEVIWLGDAHAKNDVEFDRFPPHAVAGTWGADVIDELKPHYGPVISKQRYSGFYGTSLDFTLKRLNINPDNSVVTVVGVCTDICVMDTVGGLANRDYKVVVPKHAVASFDPEGHESALKRMASIYGADII